ncbi:WD40 repeat domain-containing protein [Aggregatibacter actinomycetemcomitans]|uniref:WD40 repeat domain-containing protein n=1 Tax=Aggregatibacter actinomycetemcomitans TaxID=714 RepID=UPI00197B089A|nr:WD40 repeat domain-containing protein [Aggregatibacter actinomycetemcomitans]MBN6063232.1 WD40 repeat domain-containing protein [Aggregatibacter actinomycetemcomitans]MBN6083106.1 WD40 repeat domain-containing protein [Aggregatibacter actinomycetemcomitans]
MKNVLLLILFIVLGWGGYYVYENRHDVFSSTKGVRNLSISSDGRYVVSAHYGKKLVLWDLEKRTKEVIAERVNTNSPYFIPNSHDFMWQDKNNIVHIQNVEGQKITQFKHYKVDRHLMTEDRKLYISADQTGEIYKGYGDSMVPIYTDTAIWRHYNFDLSDKYFLSSSSAGTPENAGAAQLNPTADPVQPSVYKNGSYDGVTLWDRETLKPIARLWGFAGRVQAIFSPDGKWIIGGGENGRDYMWSADNLNYRQRLASVRGIYNPETEKYDISGNKPVFDDVGFSTPNTIAYAFVTDTEFVQLTQTGMMDGTGNDYVNLYTVGDPWIKDYVEIGFDPAISTNAFEKSNSVASAPKAHILVTGQAAHGGINVYRYHPDKMELEKIWVAY